MAGVKADQRVVPWVAMSAEWAATKAARMVARRAERKGDLTAGSKVVSSAASWAGLMARLSAVRMVVLTEQKSAETTVFPLAENSVALLGCRKAEYWDDRSADWRAASTAEHLAVRTAVWMEHWWAAYSAVARAELSAERSVWRTVAKTVARRVAQRADQRALLLVAQKDESSAGPKVDLKVALWAVQMALK